MLLALLALPLSAPDPEQLGQETIKGAMARAAQAALSISTEYESGGALYKLGSLYYYTLPVTAHSTHEIDYRIALPAGATLAALYHTHPGDMPHADELSTSDRMLASKMQVPMFVLDIQHSYVIGYKTDGFFL